MTSKSGFSLIGTLIALGVIAAIGAGFYYRGAVTSKVKEGASQVAMQTPAPTPNPATPLPSPSIRPTPGSAGSIAVLNPAQNGTPNVTAPKGLPSSGPELNLALAASGILTGGSALYHVALRRKVRKSWKTVEVL